MRRTFRRIGFLIFLHGLVCVVPAYGSPEISVRIGLDDLVVAGRYAPITVALNNLSFPVSGDLRIVQRVGNAWRGEASATIEIASGVIVNGVYAGVIPVYEPANPLLIELVDANGSIVASADVNLRDAQQPSPYPLSVGRALPVGAPAAWIPSDELPSDWTALDAVSVLWIGAAPSRAAWEAIATWVLAGGSVVIGTGSDFFRIESGLVRDLLPLDEPHVILEEGAVARVEGAFKPGARVILDRDGLPAAIAHRYGAGHVTMVSERLSDLSRHEALVLAGAVEPASMVSLDAVGQALFERLEITRPRVGAAVLLGIVATILFTGLVTYGRRHPRVGIAGIVVVSAVLSVWSGLYVNRANPTTVAYACITRVQARTLVGYYAVSAGFVTMHDEALQLEGSGSLRVRVDYTPDPLRPNYDSHVSSEQVVLALPPGQRGWYRATGSSVRSVDFRLGADFPEKVSISSWLTKPCPGVLLVDGTAYRLPVVEPGEGEYTLNSGESLESLTGFDPAFADIYQQFLEDFALGDTPWVLLFSEESHEAGRSASTPQTRIVTLYAQRGGDHE